MFINVRGGNVRGGNVLDTSESVLGRRGSTRGKPFHTVGATTKQARLCMIVVRANETKYVYYVLMDAFTHAYRHICMYVCINYVYA